MHEGFKPLKQPETVSEKKVSIWNTLEGWNKAQERFIYQLTF